MFPALPEELCQMEGSREVISHITLLYPLVLSEGIYSTLFVLYANKYSRKDEMYRQNLNLAEKLKDQELVELMGHERYSKMSTLFYLSCNFQFCFQFSAQCNVGPQVCGVRADVKGTAGEV